MMKIEICFINFRFIYPSCVFIVIELTKKKKTEEVVN